MKKAKINKNAAYITNKLALKDYEIKKVFSAGIVLLGPETKSIRMGNASLTGAFINIKDGELWLYNCLVKPTTLNAPALSLIEQTRARKLLVSKRELAELIAAKDSGLSIIPLKILTKKRYIKIDIATAKGLKKYDKRQKIKARETKRDIERHTKNQTY